MLLNNQYISFLVLVTKHLCIDKHLEVCNTCRHLHQLLDMNLKFQGVEYMCMETIDAAKAVGEASPVAHELKGFQELAFSESTLNPSPLSKLSRDNAMQFASNLSYQKFGLCSLQSKGPQASFHLSSPGDASLCHP